MRKANLGISLLSLWAVTALSGCTTDRAKVNPGIVALTDAPITVHVPVGFVAADEDEVITYPRRPMRHFHLPELPNGGTPAYPDIYIEQLGEDSAKMSLDSYIRKSTDPSQHASLPIAPRAVTIDGVRAVEFATTSETIFDFEGGGAGHADMTTHEIAFKYHGINYRCVMETGAGDTKYLTTFEKFCSSIRFAE